jgi:hydroxypyruvate reductase
VLRPAVAAPDLTAPEIGTLLTAFERAVEAASPFNCIRLSPQDIGDAGALVIGAGKAAAAMAVAFNAAARDNVRGLVVTRYGHGLEAGEDTGEIEVLEAGHPAPDAASLGAAERALSLIDSLRPSEALWVLISGGASALLAAPLPGVTLEHKREAAGCLMHAGADIREINAVRKHLSGIKGGRLAARAHPARVNTLAISDVPGDGLADIGSGPTTPDPTTQAQAIEILNRYGCPVDPAVRGVLTDPRNETPKPGDSAFAGDSAHIIANAATALDAAQRLLESHGYRVTRLGNDLDDPARELGAEHARLALAAAEEGGRHAFLSGGETRVVVTNTAARGGRNLEYLAALGQALEGRAGVFALAADTDGIDGNGDHAGGIVVPELISRGRGQGSDLAQALAANSTYDYFDGCKLLIRTGPTRTNVNDFRLILVDTTALE